MWLPRICITIPLGTDRIKLVGESKRLLAAGERGRYTALVEAIVICTPPVDA
jgi:hypothetical protein